MKAFITMYNSVFLALGLFVLGILYTAGTISMLFAITYAILIALTPFLLLGIFTYLKLFL